MNVVYSVKSKQEEKTRFLYVFKREFGYRKNKYRVRYYSVFIDFCPYAVVKHFLVYRETEWELPEFSYR